jgi:hypothetical protein
MAAATKTKLAEYKEVVDTYLVGQIADGVKTSKINFGRTDDEGNLTDKSIKEVIPDVEEFYEARLVIMRGELYYCYKADKGESASDAIPTYASELGIKVIKYGDFSYDGETSKFAGLTSTSTDADGNKTTSTYYMCTPDLSGFDIDSTYYISYDPDPTTGEITNVNTITILNKISEVYTYKNEWYDYPQKIWANVLTVNDNTMTYWVWIPRFAYSEANITTTTTDTGEYKQNINKTDDIYENIDVLFISTENKYWNGTAMVDLPEGYIVPDAFTYDGTQLGGYWISKYEVQNSTNSSGEDNTGNFIITATTNAIVVKPTDSTNTATYKVYLDGQTEDNLIYTGRLDGGATVDNTTTNCIIQGLSENSSHIITIKDTSGVRVWVQSVTTLSLQDSEEIASNLDFDLSKFDKDSTYFVLYNNEGKKPILVPFSILTSYTNVASQISTYITTYNLGDYYWFNYGDKGTSIAKIWANIATTANNTLTYWTYIPRYAVNQLGGENSTAFDVRFVSTLVTNDNISTKTLNGINGNATLSLADYYIPDAFTFDGKELAGYWMSKYEVQAQTSLPDFVVGVDQNKIAVKNVVTDTNLYANTKFTVSIISSTDTSDTPYEYGCYPNVSSSNPYISSALSSNKSYIVKVYSVIGAQVYNSDKGKVETNNLNILVYTNTFTTPVASDETDLANIKIDLTGYNDSTTKIELFEKSKVYDASENLIINSNYTYDKNGVFGKEITLEQLKANTDTSKWNGNIFSSTNGVGEVTYEGVDYIWFDYKNKIWANIVTTANSTTSYWTYIPRYKYKVDEYGATELYFISTSTVNGGDYTIPDAFTFDGKELAGYWISKYEVQKIEETN